MLADDVRVREQAVDRHDGGERREGRQQGEERDAPRRGEHAVARHGAQDTPEDVPPPRGRDLGGIVLEVGVEGHDDVAPGSGEPCGQCGRLAEVAAKTDAMDLRELAGQLRHHLP